MYIKMHITSYNIKQHYIEHWLTMFKRGTLN